jgi:histidine triad (HIT) family protein
MAFEDISPQAPVHILVIPKKHIATLNHCEAKDKELIGHIIYVASLIAEQKDIVNPGYRVVCNVNSGAGQTVFHVHFHLLGGRRLNWPPG